MKSKAFYPYHSQSRLQEAWPLRRETVMFWSSDWWEDQVFHSLSLFSHYGFQAGTTSIPYEENTVTGS